jgi:predicted HD phosphohydrolase
MMLPSVWKKGIEHQHDVAIALRKGTDNEIVAAILLQKKGNIFKDGLDEYFCSQLDYLQCFFMFFSMAK